MRFRLGFIFSLFATVALAQSGKPVIQSGNVTPNTIPWWITSGVISGGVTSADSPITSFGVTNNGFNGICANSQRITAAGRQTLCFGVTDAGGGRITLQNYGTDVAQPLQICSNGICFNPSAGSGSVVNISLVAGTNINLSGTCTITTAGTCTITNASQLCYVDGTHFANLAAAMASCTTNATIVVQSAQMISTALSSNGTGITIKCENGAVLTYTTSGRIALSGANSGIKDCILTGAGVGNPGQQAVVASGSNFTFSGNVVTNFGSTGGNGTVEIAAGSHLSVTRNVIRGNTDFGLAVNNVLASGVTMDGLSIVDNEIRNGIIIHAVSTGSMNNISIALNRTYTGENSGTEFCIETGIFGGTAVNNIVSNDNICNLLASGTNGGYSFSGTSNVVANGNLFNSNGSTFTVNGMELASATSLASASGNVLNCGTGGNCMSITSGSNTVTANSNQINGFISGSSNYGLLVGTSGASTVASNVTTNGNRISFSTGAVGQGLWFQCNATSAVCSNYTAVGNEITSDGTAGSTGIQFDRLSGSTMDGLLIGPNLLVAPATGVKIASGVTSVCLVAGLNKSSTAVTNNGASSVCN